MKKLNLILLVIIMLFVGNINIIAIDNFPQSITIGTQGTQLTLETNNSLKVTTGVGVDDAKYAYFHVKNSGNGKVVCTNGPKLAPVPNTTCSLSSFDNTNQEKGVAYIINLINNTNATDNEKYWWTEFLVNSYLGKYTNYDSTSRTTIYIINSDNKILNTNKTYKTILSEANNAANKTYTNITLSVDNTKLTFTKKEDGYYYSNPVKVTSNGSYEVTISNNKFSYDKSGENYTFKIKESDLALGSIENFTATVSSKEQAQSYYIAQNYNCGGSYQSVTLMQTKEIKSSVANPVVLSGSVEKASVSIKVGKIDSDKKFIPGAKLLFQTEEQKNSDIDGTLITSTNEYFEIKDIKAGTYYIKEIEAPTGYNKTNKVYEIIVANDGTVKIDGKTIENNIVLVINDLTETVISKKNSVNNEELPGATLEILDKDKKPISCTIIEKGKKKLLNICSWVSSSESMKIVGLPIGKYYLKENISPEGYALNESLVEFEVKGDGKTTKVEMKNELEVKVPDTLSSRSALLLAIAMFDIALGIGIITYVKKNKITE